MKFLLRCPQCKQTQQYEALDDNLINKRKRCVYCNRSFDVKKNIVRPA